MSNAVLQEILAPTAVTASVVCSLWSSEQRNLVVAKHNVLEIFVIDPKIPSLSGDQQQQSLRLIVSEKVHGDITDLGAVRLPRQTTDCLVLCFGSPTSLAVVSVGLDGTLETKALYALEAARAPNDGIPSPARLAVDPNGLCCAVLTHNRFLHVLPLTKLESTTVSGRGTDDATVKQGANAAADLWSDLLGDAPAPTTTTEAVEPSSGASFVSADAYTVDLLTLTTPLRNVRDVCVVHGYSDPTFMLLYEPDQAWVGRVKLRHHDGTNVESHTMSCAASIISFDFHTRAASVIWTLKGLPYNCTNLFPVPLDGAEYDLGGVLCFAANSVIHLAPQGTSHAAFVNRYGSEEHKIERAPFSSEVAVQILPDEQTGDLSITLANCVPTLLSPTQMMVVLEAGEAYMLKLSHSRGMVHGIQFVNLMRPSMPRLPEPSTAAILGKDCVYVGSLSGDGVVVRYVPEPEQVDNDGDKQNDDYLPLHFVARMEVVSPVVSVDVHHDNSNVGGAASNFDTCIRNLGLVGVCGKGEQDGALFFMQRRVHYETLSTFTLPSLTPDGEAPLPVDALFSVTLQQQTTKNKKRERDADAAMTTTTSASSPTPTTRTLLLVCHEGDTDFVVAGADELEPIGSDSVALHTTRTLGAHDIDGANAFVQVTSRSVDVYPADGGALSEMKPIATWTPSGEILTYTAGVDSTEGVVRVGDGTELVVLRYGTTAVNAFSLSGVAADAHVMPWSRGTLLSLTPDGVASFYIVDEATGSMRAFVCPSGALALGRAGDTIAEAVAIDGVVVVRLSFDNELQVHQVIQRGAGAHEDVAFIRVRSLDVDAKVTMPEDGRACVLSALRWKEYGLRGVFVGGETPMWVVVHPTTSQVFVHQQQVEARTNLSFTDVCLVNDGSMFAVAVNHGIRICRLQPGYNLAAQLPIKKVPLLKTPHFVVTDPSQKLFFVAEGHPIEDGDSDPSPGAPPHLIEQMQISLFDRDGRRCRHYELEEGEIVMCMQLVHISIDTEDSGGARFDSLRDMTIPKETVPVVAVGVALPRGDDLPCRGRLLLFSADAHLQSLELLHSEAMKGPVTAVTSCEAYLVATVGAKIMFYYFDWKLRRFVTASFHSATSYVPAMASVKNYLVVSDAFQSISFSKYKEASHSLQHIARDVYPQQVTACDFYHDGAKDLYVVSTDAHGNIVFFLYEPLLNGSKGLMTVVSDVRVAGHVTALRRVNLPDAVVPPNTSSSTFYVPSARTGLFAATSTGAIFLLSALPESSTRLLQRVVGTLYDHPRVSHVCGLHPRTYRIGRRDGFFSFGAKRKSPGVVDAEVLKGVWRLSPEDRAEVAKLLKTTEDQLLELVRNALRNVSIV
eukprot:PhM_4_TR17265/c0_g1_i1/m.42184/K14401/CPSF1, CFT1; cleavage and polyadenylation specificity factor subunit 1